MDSPGTALDDRLPSDRLLRATAAQWSAALVWMSADGTIVGANPGFARLAGVPLETLVGHSLPGLLDLGGRDWQAVWDGAQGDHPPPGTGSLRIPRRDPVPVDLHWQHLTDGDDVLLLCEMRGFDERERAEAVAGLQQNVLELVAAGRSLKQVLDFLCRQVEACAPEVACSVMLRDDENRMRVAAAPSLPVAYTAGIDGLPIEPDVGSCGSAMSVGEAVMSTDIAGDPRWDTHRDLALTHRLAACWSNPIKGRDARMLGSFALYYREPRSAPTFHRRLVEACVHLCALAIEHDRARAEINRLAYFDTLTGLPNRQLLADRATAALALAGRTRQPVTLMFLDIDRFKTVNDSLGHAVGDRLLVEVATRLKQLFIEGDTLARLGGDEFVALLPGCDAAHASLLAERVLTTLSVPMTVADLTLTPTASIGIAVHPNDGMDFDTLLRQADAAMYRAKQAGRNRCHFFRRDMNEQAVRRLEMEAALREALDRQEAGCPGEDAPFELHYQPQVRLKPNCLYRVEALIRWTHPRWGAVSPAEFIPLAEECGLIDRLDSWVLQTSVAQLGRWRAAGIPVPGLAVNVSAVRFARGDLPDQVRAALATNGIPANDLTLEITERLMMTEEVGVHDALDALHALGVTLSIDDFGTGYSSLGYLKRYPVGELKIDRSFVKELDIDAANRPLVRAIIQIGEALGLTVVAEGVEREAQHRMLEAEGCAIGQGYLFARPMPAATLVDWLAGEGKHWNECPDEDCISI
ncbi:diguanylate cyclase (GGDEF)-like protein [Azospirillum lipoferum]|uniref:EAL domain-containing protein n=1 Tax=Azospirillum lipoferum TaxID=193 RepID=A0A5A9GWL5_AZOLI|nr:MULTISPECIES: EAL domain-containing protein [Azospirillum]KAA0597839.1 EAL domain-containing protein [Azospirillum lipoferum]MCP1610020.1 diguanylate cyclase (GGDEF)-like protein [Azospirillum lipoferum]MDW5534487.1 EAL domain-containing protein [Azospirillum sp. NL1]